MNTNLEEKLREAACMGDVEAVQELLAQDVNVNCRNQVNGWTPLHWACKRGHETIVRILLAHGANSLILSNSGESPIDVCSNPAILYILGASGDAANVSMEQDTSTFVPNYIRNPPIYNQIEQIPLRRKSRQHHDWSSMQTTNLPSYSSSDELVLRVRIENGPDPDFIEIEIPKTSLTYGKLKEICCTELGVNESAVERIRKLPNTRLRNDNDVKRLGHLQSLELVLYPITNSNGSAKNNTYQSISTCKDQTILY